MAEYSIEIKERLAGISFVAYDTNEYMISALPKNNSMIEHLNLSIGDALISINNTNVSQITGSPQYAFKDIHHIFYDQKLPFTATFKKKEDISYENIQNNELEIIEHINTDSSLPNSPNIASHNIMNAYSPEIKSDQFTLQQCTRDTKSLIPKYIFQNDFNCKQSDIYFDKIAVTESNKKICLLSTNGLHKGTYEWTIEILKCDVYIQEIGIISTKDIDNIKIKDSGVTDTNKCLARAVYGSELYTNSVYYASYNNNETKRCFKDLSKKYPIGWCASDVIKVCLDLNQWKIKFFINGVKVRKVMSVEKGNTYYPIICFTGNCQYQLHDH